MPAPSGAGRRWWRFGRGLRLLPLLALAACAARGPVLPPDAEGVELADTPFFAQERYQCGPAALAMALQASGVDVRPDALVEQVYIPDLQGSLQTEMVAAARERGRLAYVIAPELPALLAELRAGRPVLVLENLGWDFYPTWHYAVVIGYRPEADQLVLHSGTEARKAVDADDFLDDWSKAERWGVVLLRPGEMPAGDDPARYLRAAAGLEASGAPAGAAAAYRAATRRWPGSGAAWLGLGNAEHARGDAEAAERAYRRALEADPQAVAARNNLAQVLAERGCRAAAERQIERALAEAPPELVEAVRATRDEIRAVPAKAAADCPE